MPSLALRSVATVMIVIVAGSALAGNAVTPAGGTYPAVVKVICGVVAIAGSFYLSRAISLTLLRSGGTTAFQAAYVAAAALCGLGVAEMLSALWSANISQALAAYCVVAVISGLLWVRFYGNTA